MHAALSDPMSSSVHQSSPTGVLPAEACLIAIAASESSAGSELAMPASQ